ncbi:ribonuclease Z [Enterobacter asburiae]|nr:ribonuclease Z [Enterobacter asburiae]
MELIFLGTSAGVPTRSRNVTAILLDLKHPTRGGLWLFDCGEGTQHQLLHTAYHPGKLDKIFITHLHGDHLFGLPGLLCSRSMAGNANPLTIYGPAGIREFVETTLRLSGSWTDYPLEVVEIAEGWYSMTRIIGLLLNRSIILWSAMATVLMRMINPARWMPPR